MLSCREDKARSRPPWSCMEQSSLLAPCCPGGAQLPTSSLAQRKPHTTGVCWVNNESPVRYQHWREIEEELQWALLTSCDSPQKDVWVLGIFKADRGQVKLGTNKKFFPVGLVMSWRGLPREVGSIPAQLGCSLEQPGLVESCPFP